MKLQSCTWFKVIIVLKKGRAGYKKIKKIFIFTRKKFMPEIANERWQILLPKSKAIQTIFLTQIESRPLKYVFYDLLLNSETSIEYLMNQHFKNFYFLICGINVTLAWVKCKM